MSQPDARALAQKLEECRDMVRRKQEAIDKLNQRVVAQVEIIAGRDETIQKLNQRVAAQVEIIAGRDEVTSKLNQRIADQVEIIARRDEAIGKLRDRLEIRDERDRQDSDFQTLAHNSADGMNAFFQEIEDREIYASFGRTVGALMREKHVPSSSPASGRAGTASAWRARNRTITRFTAS